MRERFVPSAAEIEAAYAQPARGPRETQRAYKLRIRPHWSGDGSTLWYRNDLSGGVREYIAVPLAEGKRGPAFDHARLAEALGQSTKTSIDARRFDIDQLQYDPAEPAFTFRHAGATYRCEKTTYALTRLPDSANERGDDEGPVLPEGEPRRSARTGSETEITFENRTDEEVELFWLDSEGARRSYGTLAAGQNRAQHTFDGHVWAVVGRDGRTWHWFLAREEPAVAPITGRNDGRGEAGAPRGRGRGGNRDTDRSPDGKWRAVLRDGNLFAVPAEPAEQQADGAAPAEIRLTEDGTAERPYARPVWSPDSASIAAWRVTPGDEQPVHRIESSPSGGGRAKLQSQPYDLPGDRLPIHELHLFALEGPRRIKPEVDEVDLGTPRVRWRQDGSAFTYVKVDRGHQRVRVIEVDGRSGTARTLVDERTATFVNTNYGGLFVEHFDATDELIFLSERSGWQHLYLIDTKTATVKNAITSGAWVVRGVDRVDAERREAWFHASGMDADQDPYFIHYFRIGWDGSGLVRLTEGNGTHTIEFSPDRKYLIDSYSRVDMPPIHDLRRVEDGSLVCRLEEADISELAATGWRPPEVFKAKGRDGVTDCWGIICRPSHFDPTKKYAVIEDIYAGPQDSFVPKPFSPAPRYAALTELGFIVAKIDGMGTRNRSKAFHDVAWHNLKDAGLPDRILWHQAAAAAHPEYDITNVGVYGTSAGGQNAAGALLFFGDFYRVGVAACGCHDNRMDKAHWNEQWMGYPVLPHYAENSNIENAARLRGKLLLIVGELDANVPPESTLRFADALIRAGKDFELLVVPGAGHGMGGAYGSRRMRDFFVRHLHGVEPPDHNAK